MLARASSNASHCCEATAHERVTLLLRAGQKRWWGHCSIRPFGQSVIRPHQCVYIIDMLHVLSGITGGLRRRWSLFFSSSAASSVGGGGSHRVMIATITPTMTPMRMVAAISASVSIQFNFTPLTLAVKVGPARASFLFAQGEDRNDERSDCNQCRYRRDDDRSKGQAV